MNNQSLVFRYIIVCLISILINILTQDFITRFYIGFCSVTISIVVGTGVGLLAKYILDKHYIFCFRTRNNAHNAKTFALYTAMGLFTTIIFWGFEFGFHYIFETKEMRYFGGVIGLVIGYFTKYRLDKRFVFRTEAF